MKQLFLSIVMGIIQGLTEFLPVSSSGHLVLAKEFLDFKTPDNMSYEIFLHLGSLIAVLIYFRKDILKIIASLVNYDKNDSEKRSSIKLLFFLMISTFVTFILYLPADDFIEKNFHNPLIAAIMLLLTGLIIFISDFIRKNNIRSSEMGVLRSILIGVGQSFALLPGISRSGTTISVSLFVNIKRKEAARYSFLLSIPAILGAVIFSLDNLTKLTSSEWLFFIAGGVASFISGFLVIAFLIKMIKKQKLKYFSFYCWTIAIISLLVIFL